jgi:hypothetical protein
MAIWRGAGGPGDATTDAANEASVASNKATEAAASAAAAAASASTASTAATSASNSATAATASASAAASSASSASSSASSASSSASAASSSASAAATSETNAETAQAAAEVAQAAAETAQIAAELAETNAETAETNAETAQAAAEAARDAALAALDSFDDRYLGTKTSDPTLDNDGNALVAGALYFNSVSGIMKVYTGSAWVAAYVSGSLGLDDLTDVVLTSVTTGQILKYNGTNWVNSSDFATSAQGSLADSATQPGDNVSDLTNDAGYLTSFTETDPVFTASDAAGITSTDITNWDAAYGWGDHAAAGYLTSFTETDPVFSASEAASITSTDTTNWDTAYGWGDHSSAGYLTDITGESIKDLSDVYSSMVPTDGQLLTWDNTNSRWDAADAPVSLPDQTGNSGEYLTTDGTTASWAAIPAGGQYLGSAAVKAIAYNAQTIGENLTVLSTYNAMSVGPITVNSGYTVTVESGARWVVI